MVTSGGTKTFVHVNRQGSVIATADTSGAPAEGPYTYDAYGNCFSGGAACGSTGVPFRFTGQRYDAETNLYYYKARYYCVGIGRFCETDPAGYAPDVNWYTAFGNDPTDMVDPIGMRHCPVGDKSCVETPDSAKRPDDPEKKSKKAEEIETVVVTAYRDKKDSDQKPVTFEDGQEDTYLPDPSGLHRVKPQRLGEVHCVGYNVVMTGIAAPRGATRAHTHPSSYGPPGSVPGPGDGGAARSSSDHVAFVMTSQNLFTIQSYADGTFSTTVTAGPPLSDGQTSQLVGAMQNWENPASNAAGATNAQRYCHR